jgi:tol-pal system protein YbgF
MIMFKRTFFAIALLAGTALPVAAQDIATRILNIENQIRTLTGQIEELNHSIQQLQRQVQGSNQQGSLELPAQVKPKQQAVVLVPAPGEGIEVIGEPEAPAKPKQQAIIVGAENDTGLGDVAAQAVPGEDGEAAIGEQQTEQIAQAPLNQVEPGVVDSTQQGQSIEQVSLTPQTESAEAMYERYYEAQLRKRYDEAETGFNEFLQKYPDNNLAGTVQYRLGEVFYARSDFRAAAANFLKGYTQYPKSRRAPDSLVMLGLSLRKLGEKEKACDALGSVASEFPRAVEAKKRAQAEYKRAGC